MKLLSAQTSRGTVVAGYARFEIITPNLIRMEYSRDGKFVDLPSWFAINRNLRDPNAKIEALGEKVEIDTGAIHLIYHNDGEPFSPTNLQAEINQNHGTSLWKPGMTSTQNLGGSLRTLDQISGPVPLDDGLLSRDGWYLLDDSNSGLFSGNWIEERPKVHGLDWYLFGYGHDYQAAFRSFTALAGSIPLPRKYALGIWYSRYWPYSADDFKQIVQEYSQHDFPLDMIVMDMDWHLNYTSLKTKIDTWTGYTWDKSLIPDPPELLRWFHQQGLHVTLNDHPAAGLQPHEENYSDYMQAIGKGPGSGITIPFDAGDKNYLDSFYQYSHVPREKEGVDFWWLDWQQYPNTLSLPGLTNLQVLNFYNYTRSQANGLRGQSFSRWAGWGDHRYPIQFSGDADTGWKMLAFEVPFTSTGGNVGAFFWSHDIGGHHNGRNEESYVRWCQFGALSAALRSHSTRDATMDRRPWTYPDWAEASMRRSFHLRSEMMPYLYTSIWQGTGSSVPFLRPLYIDNPETTDAYQNGQEYLFGNNLLVAPIASPGVGPDRLAWQAVWFPDDIWYDFFTGEKFTGPSYAVATAGIGSFPLFVRGGVPLPMQPYTARPATSALTRLVLRCYPGLDGKTGNSLLYEDDGVSTGYEKGESALTPLSYVRHGHTVTVTIGATTGEFSGQPASRQCLIELPCTSRLTACSIGGAQTAYDEKTSVNTITLPEGSIHQPISVTIDAAEFSPSEISQRAIDQRITALLGKKVDPLAEQATLNVPDDLKTAYAAAKGIALIPTNLHPYLLGDDTVLRFFHNHSPGPDHASLTFGNAPTENTVLNPGQILNLSSIQGSTESSKTNGSSLPNLVPFTLNIPEPALTLTGDLKIGLDSRRNIAAQATAESSSGDPRPAIDGVVQGYPQDQKKEWVTRSQKNDAWIKLTWPQAVEIDSIALYDRPNANDQILSGLLEFSDGTQENVGLLPNDGLKPLILHFDKKSIQWLKFTVTATSPTTENVGLAEIAVFQVKP